jgi:asparagine synthase (glutamine-hydrolysing)
VLAGYARDRQPFLAREGDLVMCGIAGIANIRGRTVERAEIERLTDLVAHRGPDGAGYWFSAERNVALGHRRLAIIDPGPGGYQPMLSGDGRHVITFNGEIYNFLELRRELEALGVNFRTQSDTEVILAAWRTWQEGMLPRFNGMWALAIFDTETGELFLARDRFGIKPLLYAMSPERLVFASEQRALVRSGLIAPSIDIDVARRLMLDAFGIEGSERTLCREVRRLQAGHCMWLRGGRLEIRRWWCTLDHLPPVPGTEAERVERFGELFRDAVALRMRSDVPIGTCLSGGFDSSAVICEMSAHAKAGMGPRDSAAWRHAFVATFPGAWYDEKEQANEAAAWAGVTPAILEIGNNQATPELERILSDSDDVYIGLPSSAWLIYQQLRLRNVLVSLDGHGADELMGGYLTEGGASAFRLRNLAGNISSRSPRLARAVNMLRMLELRRRGYYFLRGGTGAIPEQLPLVGDGDKLPPGWGSLNRQLYRMFHSTVLPTILRNFDRVSMAHGVEVRMPFMDWRLVTYTMALPDSSKWTDGYSKMIARRAMKNRMPESIRMRRFKAGFNSPMPQWLNGPLSEWVENLLAQRIPAFSEIVDEKSLEKKIRSLTAAKAWDWDSAGRVWPYLNLKWTLSQNTS